MIILGCKGSQGGGNITLEFTPPRCNASKIDYTLSPRYVRLSFDRSHLLEVFFAHDVVPARGNFNFSRGKSSTLVLPKVENTPWAVVALENLTKDQKAAAREAATEYTRQQLEAMKKRRKEDKAASQEAATRAQMAAQQQETARLSKEQEEEKKSALEAISLLSSTEDALAPTEPQADPDLDDIDGAPDFSDSESESEYDEVPKQEPVSVAVAPTPAPVRALPPPRRRTTVQVRSTKPTKIEALAPKKRRVDATVRAPGEAKLSALDSLGGNDDPETFEGMKGAVELFQRGQKYFEGGDFPSAFNCFYDALRFAPADPTLRRRIYSALGAVHAFTAGAGDGGWSEVGKFSEISLRLTGEPNTPEKARTAFHNLCRMAAAVLHCGYDLDWDGERSQMDLKIPSSTTEVVEGEGEGEGEEGEDVVTSWEEAQKRWKKPSPSRLRWEGALSMARVQRAKWYLSAASKLRPNDSEVRADLAVLECILLVAAAFSTATVEEGEQEDHERCELPEFLGALKILGKNVSMRLPAAQRNIQFQGMDLMMKAVGVTSIGGDTSTSEPVPLSTLTTNLRMAFEEIASLTASPTNTEDSK